MTSGDEERPPLQDAVVVWPRAGGVTRRRVTRSLATNSEVTAEFVRCLKPGQEHLGPTEISFASSLRCLWQCNSCGHQWEAIVSNRTGRGSGCPPCARREAWRNDDKKRSALAAMVASVSHLAAEFVTNVAHPECGADETRLTSKIQVRWRCWRGHEWEAAPYTRYVKRTGCRQCRAGRHRSRLELEVAELLMLVLGTRVECDFPVRIGRRTYRVDLYLPTHEISLDLDPAWTHGSDQVVADLRKLEALRKARFARLRSFESAPLPVSAALENYVLTADVADEDPCQWAILGLRACSQLGLPLPRAATAAVLVRELPPRQIAEARSRAAQTWADLTRTPGTLRVPDVAPHLMVDFVSCITYPGLTLADLTPSSPARCRWQCRNCGNVWEASVGNRVIGTGCPPCSYRRGGTLNARPAAGLSLEEIDPTVARLFRRNLTRPGITPAQMTRSSGDQCEWDCPGCGRPWITRAGALRRGGRCMACGRERSRKARMDALVTIPVSVLHPALVPMFITNVDRPLVGLDQLRVTSPDVCRWRCPTCLHEWAATAARVAYGSRCAPCGRRRWAEIARQRAPFSHGPFFAQRYPELAALFVRNETRPGRTPADLGPGVNDQCVFKCPRCGGDWHVKLSRVRPDKGCRGCMRRMPIAQSFLQLQPLERPPAIRDNTPDAC